MAAAHNQRIQSWLQAQLRQLRAQLPPWEELNAATGMALGVDQLFAHACMEEIVPFTAFVPCKGQDSKWPRESRTRYQDMLQMAANIVQVHDTPYFHGCMQDRNLAMRDWAMEEHNSILLAVWDGTPGGTANMVTACEGRMTIRTLNPKNM
jgi:uncharacterized phage-like protein YoqJ